MRRTGQRVARACAGDARAGRVCTGDARVGVRAWVVLWAVAVRGSWVCVRSDECRSGGYGARWRRASLGRDAAGCAEGGGGRVGGGRRAVAARQAAEGPRARRTNSGQGVFGSAPVSVMLDMMSMRASARSRAFGKRARDVWRIAQEGGCVSAGHGAVSRGEA